MFRNFFGNGLSIIFMLVIVLYLFIGLTISPNNSIKLLETSGFTQVELMDRDWFMVSLRGGDEEDVVRFKFSAVNPVGKKVVVYVYSGILKSATIRAD